jgi:hypothetical protein
MKKVLAGALVVAALGCASNEAAKLTNPAPCPPTVVLADAARLVEFDGEQRLEDVAYTAEILGVDGSCRYFEDKPIDANLKVRIAFGRGPKGESLRKDFAYFVAVTRRDMEVIEKAEFVVPVEFDAEKPVREVEEEIETIVIPRTNKDISGTNFEIVVGLVMTPQQAIYNRSGKSLKFPDLKK